MRVGVCMGLLLGLAWANSLDLAATKDPAKTGIFPVIQAEAFNKFALGGDKVSPTESYGYMLGALGLQLQAVGESGVVRVGLGAAGAGLAYDSTRRGDNLGYNYIGFNPSYNGKGTPTALNTRNYYVHNAYFEVASKREGSGYNLSLGRFFYDDGDYISIFVEGGKLGYDVGFTDSGIIFAEFAGISSMALLGDGFFWDYSRANVPRGLLSAKLGLGYVFANDSSLNMHAFYYYGISEYSAPGLDVRYETNSSVSDSGGGFNATTRLNVVLPIYDRLYMQVPVLLGGFLRDENGDKEGLTSTIMLRQDLDFYKERSHYNLAFAVQQNIGLSHARLGFFGSPLGVNIWDNSVYATGSSLNAIVYKDAFSALFFTKANFQKSFFGYKNSYGIGLDGRYTTAPAADEYSLKLTLDMQLSKLLTFSIIANYYTSIYRHSGVLNPDFAPQNIAPNTAINRSYVMTKFSFDL